MLRMAPGVAELEKMRLSPRFVAKLMEGAGEGLLVRAVEETRHRAFFIWQQHPWMSEQENWLAAEQSLLRPAQSNALKFEDVCAGQEFLISTPHLPGEVQGLPQLPQAVPRSVSRSVSPSPSSFSDGSLDSLDIYSDWDWERVASLQTTASGVQEADLTRRSARFSSARSGSARSDFSVCGLYGCGDKAESQVLRKVIRDLEERLQGRRLFAWEAVVNLRRSRRSDDRESLWNPAIQWRWFEKIHEWVFKVKMMAMKEKSISESEAKKLGSLPLRVVEGLSGRPGPPKSQHKGYKSKPRYYNAFLADGLDEDSYFPDGADEQYPDELYDYPNEEVHYGEFDGNAYFSEQEVGTYAEEHLAFLSDGGLDMGKKRGL
eukprot:s1781_g11.t2